MKIAIIGTRGIPNNYGGFEQFAEYLSAALATKGHEITVYNSHKHAFQGLDWNGVKIVHRFDPEYLIGTIGQFIYDFNCILHTRGSRYDIILQLGYTSSSIWSFLFPKTSIIITNMDGLEWKRTKYSKPVKRFLRYAEYLGVSSSHVLVADSRAIKDYLVKEYNTDSKFIPYGADPFMDPNESSLEPYKVLKFQYDMLIARLEPENNIEVILDGVKKANGKRIFLVVGSTNNSFGQYLIKKFSNEENIKFLGAIYDTQVLNNLRYHSNLYFHGHSVGGTNPSLLEAMASGSLICAHQNVFNKAILATDSYYFENSDDIASTLDTVTKEREELDKVRNNSEKIIVDYNWIKIIEQYESLFISALPRKNLG